MKLCNLFVRIAADVRGATAIEYGLILALVFLAMVGAAQGLGVQISETLEEVSTTSANAMAKVN
jgi:pilus assembly protein Flp/PilA